MSKKKIRKKKNSWIKKYWWVWFLSALFILGIAGVILFFPKILLLFQQIQIPTGLDIGLFDTLNPSPQCSISLNQRNACVGDSIRGTLIDGKNANCIIAYSVNLGPWTPAAAITTNTQGRYTRTETAGTAGEYTFAALCIDPDMNICRTNDAFLSVRFCPTGDDSDGDGFTDEEEEQAGTDPFDPYDYPTNGDDYTCGIPSDIHCQGTCPPSYPYCVEVEVEEYKWACMCTNHDAQVHPDWKPGGDNFYEHDETPINGDLEYKDNIEPSEAIPGLTYGEEDRDGCVTGISYVELCENFVDSNVDSAHCESDTERMIPCSEGWNNCGGDGTGTEGPWYCCNFKDIEQYLQGDCCGQPGCDVVCERWYQLGS